MSLLFNHTSKHEKASIHTSYGRCLCWEGSLPLHTVDSLTFLSANKCWKHVFPQLAMDMKLRTKAS